VSDDDHPYQDADTEELKPGDPEIHAAHRTYLCLKACQGIDDVMVEMLGGEDANGKTVMQNLLDQVTWTNLPVPRRKIDKNIGKAVKPDDDGKLPSIKFV